MSVRGLVAGVLALVAATLALGVVAVAVVVVPAFVGNRPVVAGPLDHGLGEIVEDGYVSVALLDLGEGRVALVDAGNSSDGGPILAALAARGAGTEDVEAILLTHAHPDHVAACGRFPRARTFLLAPELPYARGELSYHGAVPRLFPPQAAGCAELVPVEDGFTTTLGRLTVEALAVPGHTAGSAAWLVGDVAFLGDSGMVRSDGTVEGAPWFFSDDPARNERELTAVAGRLVARGIRVAHNSHTGPASTTDLEIRAARSR